MNEVKELFDPVYDSQKVFVALMNALSCPGCIFLLEKREFIMDVDRDWNAVASVLSTLCEREVPPSFSHTVPGMVRDALVGICGCRDVVLNQGTYVVFAGTFYDTAVESICRGSLEFPETSCTAVILGERISDNPFPKADSFVLKGPGIKKENALYVSGINPGYFIIRNELNDVFPMGIDYLLCDVEGRVCALPRTTRCDKKGDT